MSHQNGTSAHSLLDTQEVDHALGLLVEPGQVVEVRVLEASTQFNARYTDTQAGYFDNAPDLIRAISDIRTAMGIYITLQPVHPDILHRAKNKLVRQKKGFSTPDKYITGYRWLLIDSDPERVPGISSKDEEHEQALAHSRTIREELARLGWPNPVLADSGNGAHLLYRIDLKSSESDLVRRVLEGLAERFDEPSIHVDQTVYNPSRICKLYGTLACKGDNTAERPHRLSRLLAVPETITTVSRAQLEAMAAPASQNTPDPAQIQTKHSPQKTFDLAAWIAQHGIATDGPEPYQGGTRWVLKTCPWDASHTEGKAVIIERPDGKIGAMCQHASCHGKGWKDLRVIYEPDAYQKSWSGERKQATEETVEPSRESTFLPSIQINNVQLRDKVDEAIKAIMLREKGNPTLFMQASRLVRIGRDEKDRPVIVQMGVSEVKEVLTHAANFYRILKSEGEDGEVEKVAVSPPKEIAEQILARQAQDPYLPFPALEAIVETPVLRPDGSILDRPGYDKKTRLYYVQTEEMKACTVPENPSQEERDAALALIWDAFGEFAYVSLADRANALALLLTPLVRPAIKRHVPLALADAPMRGTGKGLFCDGVAIIATGESAPILTMSENPDELKKTITSILIEGATIILIDNIIGRLQSKHLDAVLTSDIWKDRLLGVSKMVRVPQRATWIATGNNIRLGGDLVSRCYRVRMDAHTSRPDKRKGFKHPELPVYLREHRAELVAALLTLARAWFVAGQPEDESLPSMRTFTGWVKVVGGILKYAGVADFLSNLDELVAQADEDQAEWEAFLASWYERFGDAWVTTATLTDVLAQNDLTQNELVGVENNLVGVETKNEPNSLFEALPEWLQVALKEKPKSFKVSLGKALEKRIDACFGAENLRLEKGKTTHGGRAIWRVFRQFGRGGRGSFSPSEDENLASINQSINEKQNVSGIDGKHPDHPDQIGHSTDESKMPSGLTSGSVESQEDVATPKTGQIAETSESTPTNPDQSESPEERETFTL